MRSATNSLRDHLNALRTGDAKTLVADLYTFALRGGLVLTYTNADVSIDWNGYLYLADSVLVEGLKLNCASGLDVDQQQITISARTTDKVDGVPFLQAVRNGVFDGCEIVRERAFLESWNASPIGSVTMFKGRVGTIDRIGRVTAEVTVNSDLVLLDLDMPRNMYTPNCQHVLYDSGCTLAKAAFGTNGYVASGSTAVDIIWSAGSGIYNQGTITFTSGSNNGVTANVKHGFPGGLRLSYPLPTVPVNGDSFVVYQGCDHTRETCRDKFGNLANFRGFPYIPQPSAAV
jgi:uncharacterized phage protein (TIGR02218 family)